MLVTLARGLFLLLMAGLIVSYAVSVANSSPPPPLAPGDYVVQWC